MKMVDRGGCDSYDRFEEVNGLGREFEQPCFLH